MPSDFIEGWFDAFVAWLGRPAPGGSDAPSPIEMGEFLVETLSDASNELAATAVAAAHLRRYGRSRFESIPTPRLFWSRSEWGKWDLTYGVADRRFADWDVAWSADDVGEMGVMEAKVVYRHFATSKRRALAGVLANQLAEREESYRKERGRERTSRFALHGLVFVYSQAPGDESEPTFEEEEMRKLGLRRVRKAKCSRELTSAQFNELWPLNEVTTAGTLELMLYEYRPVR